jgi:hypothetical protein
MRSIGSERALPWVLHESRTPGRHRFARVDRIAAIPAVELVTDLTVFDRRS